MAASKRSMPYEKLKREELIARIRTLEDERDEISALQPVVHDLQVAQEELQSQNAELQDAITQLVATRDRFTDLYDFAPVGYLTLDASGLILGANLTACTLLKLERSRLVGLPLLGRVVREDRLVLLEHLRQCRTGRSPVTSE